MQATSGLCTDKALLEDTLQHLVHDIQHIIVQGGFHLTPV